jgi:benzoyl-CoA reductase/2-hydroxyglutaryl-CoA dehydratase subunit BcrC/BadD/HgdB
MYVLELPQKPDEEQAYQHWLAELHKFRQELSRRFGRPISDDDIRTAIRDMNRERALRRALAELMAADQPLLTGRQLLGLKSSISCIPEDLAQYEKALAHLRCSPIPADSAGVAPGENRTRVLLTGVPVVRGAERVVEIIEGSGGLIVCMENCTGLKPILEDVDESIDPMEALARKYLHLPCSVMTPNRRRLESIAELAKKYRPDCVIELIWQACLTYSVESNVVRQFVERELSLPYLMIETDYSPSDSARIAVRVEALFEMVAGKRQRR